MPRKGRKKIKDLVDLLEEPDNSTYVGGDYEDIMELLEKEEVANPEEAEGGQEGNQEE